MYTNMSSNMDVDTIHALLNAGPSLNHSILTLPTRVIRIYVAATATDSVEERNYLVEHAYPKLRYYCREKYGLEFQIVDLRWGIKDEWSDISMDRQLAMDEIEHCRSKSAGPNFVAFIGQKYGPVPLPAFLPATEFELLRSTLQQHRNRETRDMGLLDVWYKLDENAVPPIYVLQDLEKGKEEQQVYQEKANVLKEDKEKPFNWDDTRASLKRLLYKGLEYCVLEGTMMELEANNYMLSDLESELLQGLMNATDPLNTCVAFIRNIVDIKNYATHSHVDKYVVTSYDEEEEKVLLEPVSIEKMDILKKNKLPRWISKANIHEFEVLWKHDVGIHSDLHSHYLSNLSNKFQERMRELINRVSPPTRDEELLPVVKEVIAHWRIVKDQCQGFVGRNDLLDCIEDYIYHENSKPLVLYGESGTGKTATMSMAAAKIRESAGDEIINVVRFIGTTAASGDVRQLLYNICQQIYMAIGEDVKDIPTSYVELQNLFVYLLEHIPPNKHLVIFLDSLHMLVPQYDAFSLRWIPQNLCNNVKLIISTLPSMHKVTEQLIYNPVTHQSNHLEVGSMSTEDCMLLLTTRLNNDGRTLSNQQQDSVINAIQQCPYPLYINLVSAYVRNWSSALNHNTDAFPASIKSCINQLFDSMEQKYGCQLVSKCLAYLTASTTGVSECELEDLLSLDDDVLNEVYDGEPTIYRIPPLHWLRIKYELKMFLLEKECEDLTTICWSHRAFLEASKERYLKNEDQKKQIHSLLADYYLGTWNLKGKPYQHQTTKGSAIQTQRLVPNQPMTFEGDNKIRFNKRKYEQVPRHLYLSGRSNELNDLVLFSYEWLYNKTKALSLEHVLTDFVLNPGVESTLVERALRDAQPFINDDTDNMAPEISGRLLCYYSTHLNIRKLIDDCDSAGLKHCALVPNFPYQQIPGSPLRYTVNCQIQPNQFAVIGDRGQFLLAKDSSKNSIQIFDLTQGDKKADICTSIGDMQVTPGGRYIIIVDNMTRKSVKIHSSTDGKFIGQLIPMNHIMNRTKQKYKLDNICASNTHICMIVTMETSYLCIAEIETCQFVQVIGLEGKCTLCTITPDAQYVFCNSYNTLVSYDLQTMSRCNATQFEYKPHHLTFNRDASKGFLINNDENKVHVLVIAQGVVEFVYKVVVEDAFKEDQIKEVCASHNDDMVLVRGDDNMLVYHMGTEKIISQIRRPADVPREFKLPKSGYVDIHFTHAHFSPDDKCVIASIFRNVFIWSINDNRLLTTLQTPVGIIEDLFVPLERGQIVTHSRASDVIHVWSLGDAMGSMGMLDKFTSSINEIKVTANDKTAFVKCTGSDEIGIVDLSTGDIVDLMTHESPVVDFAITADGQYMAVSISDSKANLSNKIWHTGNRKIMYEFGKVTSEFVALANESTIISIMKTDNELLSPYRIRQFKFKEGTFDEYQFDNEIKFLLAKPFVTPEDKYLVLLSADGYNHRRATHMNPTICAISLQSSVTMSTFSAKELDQHVHMEKILHIRPYENNSYSVIVLFTNEENMNEGGTYDQCYNFMIFDVCSGVVCQVIDNFMAPSTPIDSVLFTKDVRYCLDHQANMFDMATGFFLKKLCPEDVKPSCLALNGQVAVFFKGSHLMAIRLCDSKCVAHINVHNEITTLRVCNDQHTIIGGCADGSLISYILIDQGFSDAKKILSQIHSRKVEIEKDADQSRPSSRTWDKVDFENERSAPPYSRPPSAALLGISDRDILHKVRPVSRTLPASDTGVHTSPSQASQACVVM